MGTRSRRMDMALLASMPPLLETLPLAQRSAALSAGSPGSSLWALLEAVLESVLLLDVCPSPCGEGRWAQSPDRHPMDKLQEPTLTLGGCSGESLPGSSHWPGRLFPEAAENPEGPGTCHSSSGRARRGVGGGKPPGEVEAIGLPLP